MSEPIEQMDGDEVLAYSQYMRRKLVTDLTKNNKHLDDPKVMNVVLSALSGLDKQVLTLKKIASDEGLGDNMLAAAAIIAEVFNDSRTAQFNHVPLKDQQAIQDAIVTLDPSIVPTKTVAGELAPVGAIENFDSFMGRMNDQVFEVGE